MKKVLWTAIACVTLLLVFSPVICSAEVDVWDGSVDTSWYDGAASETYYINTAAHLAGLAKLVNEGNSLDRSTFELGAGLDLDNRPWTPIGKDKTHFGGIFKGNGHSITNLNVRPSESDYYGGLFGQLSAGAWVNAKHGISDLNVSGQVQGYIAGGIVGTMHSSYIVNCTFTGTVTGISSPNGGLSSRAGGLVGFSEHYSQIEYCASYATVTDNASGLKGTMVGSIENTIIYASYNAGVGEQVNGAKILYASDGAKPHGEAAFRMNQGKQAKFQGQYFWKHNDSGVSVTKTAADATTQKFILNPSHAGAATTTLYGRPDLTLPTPEPRNDGYTFYMWLDAEGNFYQAGDTIEAQGEHALTAQWVSTETCTVTIGSPENGTIEVSFPDAPDVKYREGARIENVCVGMPAVLHYVADPSYTLGSMTVNGGSVPGLISAVRSDNENCTVSAEFIGSQKTDQTVASVTIASTGGITYYDTFPEAVAFVNAHPALSETGDVSQAVIGLCKNVTLNFDDGNSDPGVLPHKPCTIDGENGDTDFTLGATTFDRSKRIYLFAATHLRNLCINAEYIQYPMDLSLRTSALRVTLENIQNAPNINCSIQFDWLTVQGYLGTMYKLWSTNLTLDKARITNEYTLRCDKNLTLHGESTLSVTVGLNTNDDCRLYVYSYAAPGGDGTLTISKLGSANPKAGDGVVRYTTTSKFTARDCAARMPLDLGDGIAWRYRGVADNDIYETLYKLYNPTLTLESSATAPVGVGTEVTLTATPSTGENVISSTDYRWYLCDDAQGAGAGQIEGANLSTYQPDTAAVGTKYYYCVLPDENGEDVISPIVSVTATLPALSAPTGIAWDADVPTKATWTAVEDATGYSVQLACDPMKTIEPVTVASTVTGYDFASSFTGAGSYTFTVTAIGDGVNNADSDPSVISDDQIIHAVEFVPMNGGDNFTQYVVDGTCAADPSQDITKPNCHLLNWYWNDLSDPDNPVEAVWNFTDDAVTADLSLWANWVDALAYDIENNTTGTLTLSQDYTLTDNITIDKAITIDLNGHIVDCGVDYAFYMTQSASGLTLIDGVGTGVIEGTSLGSLIVQSAGTLDIRGGTVDASAGDYEAISITGGSVTVSGSAAVTGGTAAINSTSDSDVTITGAPTITGSVIASNAINGAGYTGNKQIVVDRTLSEDLIVVSGTTAMDKWDVADTGYVLVPANNDGNALIARIAYTITFNPNGGSAVAPITRVAPDSLITAPTAPTKAECDFIGWYKEAALTDMWYSETDTVGGDITLYARWKINLAPPANPAWSTTSAGSATWSAVTNASSYSVQLYKGGTAQGNPVSASGAAYDFTEAITEPGGSYTFTVIAKGDGMNYGDSPASAASQPYIYQKRLTVTGTTVDDKVYDGTTDAVVTCGTVSGIVSGDEVTVTASGAFGSPDVGKDKQVTVTYALTGAAAGNYLPPASETLTASILSPAPTPVDPPVDPPAPEPEEPYITREDGTTEQFPTVGEALESAKPGETVTVPARIEVKGELTVPAGVSLLSGGYLYTNPDNVGRLSIGAGGKIITAPGEEIHIRPAPEATAKAAASGARFTGLTVEGTLECGGKLILTNARANGEGIIRVAGAGEVTLNGASALGKVSLAAGRTIALGASFTADQTAATVYLGDDYTLGRRVLTLAGDTGKYAPYFALGDAPDDAWYIGGDGCLTSQPTGDKLLLDALVMGKGAKIGAMNLLPVTFKGGVTWTSDNPSALKVVGKGQNVKLKAVKPGAAKLTAAFADGAQQVVPVTVVLKKEAANKLSADSALSLRVGDSKAVKVAVKPASALDKALRWFTTDETIATVDSTGLVTAVSKGKCKVYALTTGGARKIVAVTVKGAKRG